MQVFELETGEHEPFFGNNQSGGGIGDFITKYNLFGQKPADQQQQHPHRSNFSLPNIHIDIPYERILESGQTVVRSRWVQKSFLGLIAFAVIMHLALDSSSNNNNEQDPFPIQSPPPNNNNNNINYQVTQPSFPHGQANLDTNNHNSMRPPDETQPNGAHVHMHNQVKEHDDTTIIGVPMDMEPPPAHSFTFGGDQNMGHNTATLVDIEDALEEEEINNDAWEKMGPWDLDTPNLRNEAGHYVHDPRQSPYASSLYGIDSKQLQKRQVIFEEQRQEYEELYGAWDLIAWPELCPAGFTDHVFRDVPLEELDDAMCWQKDKEYIGEFLEEAQALVNSMLEGIQQEYGKLNPDDEDQQLFDVIIDHYEWLNGTAVNVTTLEKLKGVAYMPQRSWDALVRKLLHAIITEDHFYVVVAGKADTYGRNNFAQSQVMQFNYLTEPVLDKLGVKLISRNMGMDASTAVSALGGADIYGETDILWHIQDANDEETHGEFDLLHRQAILSGERVPIILSSNNDELVLASKGLAWVGNLQPGNELCQGAKENPACEGVGDSEHQYESVCWVHRSDWNPEMEQVDEVGSPVEGCPGRREHQLEARKMTLLLLRALNAAIELWRQELSKGSQLPLDVNKWHVADEYVEVRKSTLTLRDREPGEALGLSASCELLMKDLDPRICHLPMHAYTEWTPRVVPKRLSLVKASNNTIVGAEVLQERDAYIGPDLLPISWAEDPDVHMIAIATKMRSTIGEDDDVIPFDDDHHGPTRGLVEGGNGRNLVRVQPNEDTSSSSPAELDTGLTAPDQFLDVVSGEGWRLVHAPVGFCDGSAQSRCNRTIYNECLLANHNHYKGSLVGSSKNGWLSFSIYGVRHGIILARLEFQEDMPGDLRFHYAVNGETKSVNKAELKTFGMTLVDDLTVYPLLLDDDVDFARAADDMKYEVSIRIQSELDPDYEVRMSHLYFS